jgi:hypothetical protein
MLEGESTMLLWRKLKKLQMLSLVCFPSTTSALQLFDSRASHSFISTTDVEKHNLPIALLKCQIIVCSLRGDMPLR